MTKEIEGKLVAALVYLESKNYQAVKEQIEEVIRLFEYDRLKKSTKEENLVRQQKGRDRTVRKDKKRTVKKG